MPAFPPCFVINLDRDADRLAHMERECEKAGIRFTRLPALRGDNVPGNLAQPYFEDALAAAPALLSNGEVGCYASHLAICMKIAAGEVEAPCLVLEDDVELAPDFASDIRALIAALPEGWDIVRLSNETKHAFAPVKPLQNGRRLIRYSIVPDSTGALIWSGAGARKFVERAQRHLAIDQDLRRPWFWNLETYGVTPAPVKRDALGQSSIEDMAGEKTWRGVAWRKSQMRRWRSEEAMARHRHGAMTLGPGLWATLLTINLVSRAVRKPHRLAFVERMCLRLRAPA